MKKYILIVILMTTLFSSCGYSSCNNIKNYHIEIIALVISLIALLLSALKDFIIPCILKPKLKYEYINNKSPFYRKWDENHFYRFSIKNTGKTTAINCRCQIIELKGIKKQIDLQGFPLKWSTRYNVETDPLITERLNISRDEIEFVDLCVIRKNKKDIFFNSSRCDLGMPNSIESGEYEITILVSGDNFEAQKLSFKINKENNDNPESVKIKLL